MIARSALALLSVVLLCRATPVAAQSHVGVSGGEVTPSHPRADASRLATRVPAVEVTVRIAGDSAQRVAMWDYEWRGHVLSVEFDEEDGRSFWDVKIAPDSSRGTVVRYRIDAASGGILDIREFTGVRGVASRQP